MRHDGNNRPKHKLGGHMEAAKDLTTWHKRRHFVNISRLDQGNDKEKDLAGGFVQACVNPGPSQHLMGELRCSRLVRPPFGIMHAGHAEPPLAMKQSRNNPQV
ncbi:hypothetical protein AMTR_s00048p00182050 [Amborella trichopoda]|uniref:Uncharacterized protein n=1 Tax=Amborella trichopoda TaxID=13333 RepID=U5D2J3_AMBTC|nr:hypothetical protein AMTR_s00048p00182050 [Amborella trichopoda]